MSAICTVCNDRQGKSESSFFTYPKDPRKRRKWLQAMNREYLSFTLRQEEQRNYFKICERHFESKYIKSKHVKFLSEDAIPTINLSKLSNSTASRCQNATKAKKDIVCISMDECNINAFKIPTANWYDNDRLEMERLIHTDENKMKKAIDLEINVTSLPTENLKENDDKDLEICSVYKDQLKISTHYLCEKDSFGPVSIHKDKEEREKLIDSEINAYSVPTVSLKEKDDKDSVSRASLHTDKNDLKEVMDLGENVNSLPRTNFQNKFEKELQSYNVYENQSKISIVNDLNEIKDPQCKATHVLIPQRVFNLIQNRLKLDVVLNHKNMKGINRSIKRLELVRERLIRKRSGIRWSLAILRKKYGWKDQKRKSTKPLQDPYAEVDLLDIKEEKISEKLNTSNQTEANTLINEGTHTSSISSRVELIRDPLPVKIFESHTLNEDNQTSNDASCIDLTRDPLPIKFEVFDETEEDAPPVHLMTSHISMANTISSMPDFLLPSDTFPVVTSVPATPNTEGQGALDEYDRFALSLAKSMKHLSTVGDKINLVIAMQNLVSEYVTRDMKSAFPNASFTSDGSHLRGLMDPAYAAQDQDAANILLLSLRNQIHRKSK